MPHLSPQWKQSSIAYVSLVLQEADPKLGVSTKRLGKKQVRKQREWSQEPSVCNTGLTYEKETEGKKKAS